MQRLALSGLAVALSVAFVAGTLILSDNIDATFTALFTSTAADVTITPRQAFTPAVEDAGLAGPPATLPAATLARVTGLPGIAGAHGQVSVQNLTVVWDALRPFATDGGGYVNFQSEVGNDRAQEAYGAKYERLAQIKAKYDPDNVLHRNANIKPNSRGQTAVR